MLLVEMQALMSQSWLQSLHCGRCFAAVEGYPEFRERLAEERPGFSML